MRKIGIIVGEKIGLKNFSNIDVIAMTEVEVDIPAAYTHGPNGAEKIQEQVVEALRMEGAALEQYVLGEEREKIYKAFE